MFVRKIRNYIQENRLICRGDRIMAAVSGGADSVCLFLVLLELADSMDFSLEVVHVEHGIRGEESLRDAEFVRNLCRQKGIRCRICAADVPKTAREEHMGLEEAARKLRYQAFERVVSETDSENPSGNSDSGKPHVRRAKIALAHHMEDNAETVLFRLARGTGIAGLGGIQPMVTRKELTCIRPLLGVSRKEIEAWLGERGQAFCTDATNSDVDFARNRVRMQILPELSCVNDRAVEHIQETAAQLSEIWDYLRMQTQKCAKDLMKSCSGGVSLEILPLMELHPALREQVFLYALGQAAEHRKDLGAVHVRELEELCRGQSGRSCMLPYGIEARRVFDRLEFGKSKSHAGENRQADESKYGSEGIVIEKEMLEKIRQSGEKARVFLPEGGEITLEIRNFDQNFEKISKKPYTKCLDYDKIKGKLEIRHRRPGDTISIGGGHRKKLKALMIEDKIPAAERDQVWVLAEENRILWVMGGRIGEYYKVSKDTEHLMVCNCLVC